MDKLKILENIATEALKVPDLGFTSVKAILTYRTLDGVKHQIFLSAFVSYDARNFDTQKIFEQTAAAAFAFLQIRKDTVSYELIEFEKLL